MGGFSGYGGSLWVMGEWAVGQWIMVASPAFRKYMVCIVYIIIKWNYGHIMGGEGGFCGYGGSVWVMGEWAVDSGCHQLS